MTSRPNTPHVGRGQDDFEKDFPPSVRDAMLASLTPADFETMLRRVYAKGYAAGARQMEAEVGPLLPRATITAAMVSALRDKTDAPMMACKKALVDANGDMDRAQELLRAIGMRFLAGRG